MVDFDSTHCAPLPVELFRLPQEIGMELDPVEISDFVDVSSDDL